MSIAEKISLEDDGASAAASKIASALGRVAKNMESITAAGEKLDAGKLEAFATAALKADPKVAIASIKASSAEAVAAGKSASAEAINSAKLAAADQLAKNKAIADLIKLQASAANDVGKAQVEGATAAEAVQKKIADLIDKETKAEKDKAAVAAKAPSATMNTAGQDQGAAAEEALGGVESGLASIASEIGSAIVGALEAAFSKLVDLTEQGAKIAIDSGTFKENTLLAFEALTGSASKANDMYGKALDLADKIGLSKEEVVKRISALMTGGMGEKEALEAVKAVGDVTQVLGETAGNKVGAVLTKIQAGNKADKASIESLKRYGIEYKQVYAEIAKATGKSVAEATLAVKAGQVDAKTGIAAIEKVIEEKFGGLGEKAGASITRKLGDIQDEFKRLFDEITEGPGGQAVKKLLGTISDSLTGPGGQKLRAAFNELFGSLGSLFGGMLDGAGVESVIDGVAGAIKRIGEFVKDLTPGIQGMVKGLMKGFGQMSGITGGLASAWLSVVSMFGGAEGFWEKVGQGIGIVVSAVVALVEIIGIVITFVGMLISGVGGALYAVVGLLGDVVQGMYDTFMAQLTMLEAIANAFMDQGSSMGTNLIDGIVGGIKAGVSAVVDAIVNMASSAISAGKNAFKTHSPSQLFHDEIGVQIPAGVGSGVAAGTHHMTSAIDKMASLGLGAAAPLNDNARPWGAKANGAGGSGQGGDAGSGGGDAPVQINVNVTAPQGANPQEFGQVVGETIRPMVRSEMSRRLRAASGQG